jgi:hypothetical protein
VTHVDEHRPDRTRVAVRPRVCARRHELGENALVRAEFNGVVPGHGHLVVVGEEGLVATRLFASHRRRNHLAGQRHNPQVAIIAHPGAHHVGVGEGADVVVAVPIASIVHAELVEVAVRRAEGRVRAEAEAAVRDLRARVGRAYSPPQAARADARVHGIYIVRGGCGGGRGTGCGCKRVQEEEEEEEKKREEGAGRERGWH